MASIIPFLKDTYSPEDTQLMREAYALATKDLHDSGQPAMVQEIIAERIINFVVLGERDPQKVASKVLESLGITTE